MVDKYFYKVCAAISLALICIAVHSEYLADEYTLFDRGGKPATIGAFGSLKECEAAATYSQRRSSETPLSRTYVCIKIR